MVAPSVPNLMQNAFQTRLFANKKIGRKHLRKGDMTILKSND